jgi:hypothetical protein
MLIVKRPNTGLSRATSQHVIEIHARVVASAAGRVRIKPAIYHDIFCPNERYILFLPRFCFLLFHVLYSSPVFIFPSCLSFGASPYFIFASYFIVCFFHDTLCLAAFKMGVKSVRTVTIFPCSPRCLSFVALRYFRFHRDAIFLLRHDISESTAILSFVTSRYF